MLCELVPGAAKGQHLSERDQRPAARPTGCCKMESRHLDVHVLPKCCTVGNQAEPRGRPLRNAPPGPVHTAACDTGRAGWGQACPGHRRVHISLHRTESRGAQTEDKSSRVLRLTLSPRHRHPSPDTGALAEDQGQRGGGVQEQRIACGVRESMPGARHTPRGTVPAATP